MHILVIAELFPPDMGGGSTRAYNAVKGLLSLGCRLTVVTAFPHYPTGNIPQMYRHRLLSTEDRDKLRLIRTWVPPLASKGIANRLVLFVSFIFSSLFAFPFVGKIDVVWAANPNIFSVFPALFYGRVKTCPVVQNVDDLWPEGLYDLGMLRWSWLRRSAELVSRFTYIASDAITPVSPSYVEVIVNKYEVSEKKIFVVPAGVDMERFRLLESSSDKKGTKREFKVTYIGAFSPTYDFNQVLKAAELLKSEKNIRILIQGGGELADTLKLKVKDMRLSNVVIIDKIVSRDEVARILSDSDALLLPLSGLEFVEMGISSKLYEYQAAGKPIICCSSGQPGRYVSETKSGIVVKPGDYEALAKSILYLRENQGVAKKLGTSGRRYVENNLTIEKIGLKMECVFRFTAYSRARRTRNSEQQRHTAVL